MELDEEYVSALTDMGLNDLEARAYLALLAVPDITGYRVGKMLGKPVSNVYQALKSLARKGMVVHHSETGSRLHSPVPVDEVVSRLRTDLDSRAKRLEEMLRRFERPEAERGIYRIENSSQLFERIDRLLESAQSSVLLTADGFFLRGMIEQLERTAARGVSVLILGYEEIPFEGCEFIRMDPGKSGPWTGHWIVADFDCSQHIVAFFSKPDLLTHAIWCNDLYLSYWIHFGLLADFTLMGFFQTIQGDDRYREIGKKLHALYRRYCSVGPELQKAFRPPDESKAD